MTSEADKMNFKKSGMCDFGLHGEVLTLFLHFGGRQLKYGEPTLKLHRASGSLTLLSLPLQQPKILNR